MIYPFIKSWGRELAQRSRANPGDSKGGPASNDEGG